jgi:DNA-binding LacI/PurR family transcriptional regulator
MRIVVTLLEVAKAAGVSKTTAANVFSRPERVRPALRARVEAVARTLGYDGPDPKGRLLSSGKFNAIGVVPSAAFGITLFFRNSYLVPFLEGVASVCEENGVGLSLVSGRSDQAASGIRGALVDGFIFSSLEQADMIEPARRRRLPFVVMDVDGGPEVSSVRVEDRDGGRQVARHLLALGHRRFIAVAPLSRLVPPVFHEAGASPAGLTAPTAGVADRLAGFLEVLASAGIGAEAVQVVEACLTREEEAAFGDAGAALLGRLGGATAVVGLTDGVALAILDKARRRGLSVPRELSVTGFDDVPAAVTAVPPLTTVAQPVIEKGRAAARLLLEGGPPRQVGLPVALVVRESTAQPGNSR